MSPVSQMETDENRWKTAMDRNRWKRIEARIRQRGMTKQSDCLILVFGTDKTAFVLFAAHQHHLDENNIHKYIICAESRTGNKQNALGNV